ncbi:hypothetical protein [Streptomyces qinglanensis]|uniref:hypothetical protein n=1 Tax=Streptomyces qinglanensis TaxID=943816 RepID=UPI003D7223F1
MLPTDDGAAVAAVRDLSDRIARASDMPPALEQLAAEAVGEYGLLEQVVALLMNARERVQPYADFENADGAEWSLWRALGLAAEDLQDRRAELTEPLAELGVLHPAHHRP